MSTARLLFDFIERHRDSKDTPWQLRSRLEELQWFEGFADGRDAPKGVVAANWNDISEYDPVTKTRVVIDTTMSRLCDLFEKYGVEIEWSDQASSCGGCYKCIQTQPDCFSWRPQFYVTDGDILCESCLAEDPESALEESEGGLWSLEAIDPAEHGYTQVEYDGHRDYLEEVCRDVKRKFPGISRFLITNPRQWEWHVYVRDTEE